MHSYINNKPIQKLLTVIDLDINSRKPLELIHRLIEKRILSGKPFFGIEVSPCTSNAAVQLNFNDFQHLSELPLFTSITWMAPDNVHTKPITEAPSIKLAQTIRTVPVVLHLTCSDLTADVLEQIMATDVVTNIVALRGGNLIKYMPT